MEHGPRKVSFLGGLRSGRSLPHITSRVQAAGDLQVCASKPENEKIQKIDKGCQRIELVHNRTKHQSLRGQFCPGEARLGD